MSLFRKVLSVVGGLLLVVLVLLPVSGAEFDPDRGDRVAFVGGRQAEGRTEQGYLETFLTAAFPDRELTFRNLAWTGDQVDQRERSDPFPGLFEWLDRIGADHVFVSYGQMEALRGEDKLEGFVQAYARLLDAIEDHGLGVVMVSPVPQEPRSGRSAQEDADTQARNQRTARYTKAIGELARKRGYPFVNLFDALRKDAKTVDGPRMTTNGVYLTEWGYWRAAQETAATLGIDLSGWRVAVTASGDVRGATGTDVRGM